jgi:hypothetical protein
VKQDEMIPARISNMMMESYFDDSADPRRSKFYACGGLLGGPEQWDAFEILWSQQTHKLKEPFRSTDCETGHGQFKDWPKTQRDELMARLVGTLKTVQLRGFASIVPIKAYKAAFPACGEHDAFLLALRQAIMNMAYIAHELSHDVALCFEKGAIDSKIHKVFDSIADWKEWPPTKRLRTPRFDTKQLKALQSADLIAREAFKHVDNLGVRPTRIPVARMEDRLYFVFWNEKALKYLALNGGPGNLELLAKWDQLKDAPRLGPIEMQL